MGFIAPVNDLINPTYRSYNPIYKDRRGPPCMKLHSTTSHCCFLSDSPFSPELVRSMFFRSATCSFSYIGRAGQVSKLVGSKLGLVDFKSENNNNSRCDQFTLVIFCLEDDNQTTQVYLWRLYSFQPFERRIPEPGFHGMSLAMTKFPIRNYINFKLDLQLTTMIISSYISNNVYRSYTNPDLQSYEKLRCMMKLFLSFCKMHLAYLCKTHSLKPAWVHE